ncbi:DUF2314 domain-containing protein [Novosphingobium sp. PS1R-30]|uniref:DUF2314 domain-containing protein n=1 Tax=Novosphingobium anseongense TaxID=3133436 RepID=A0ABU8RUJ4_9SPHN
MLNLTPMLPPALALAALLSTPPAAAAEPRAEPDATVDVRTDDRRMNAAKAKARRTLPSFLAVLAAPPAGARDLSFKYPLEGWEHIWVEQVVRRGESLTGRLANNPQARGYRLGQRVTVPLSAVSDWAYRDGAGVMQGHFTTRALLSQLAPDEARQIREAFGWATPRRRLSAAKPPP